MHRFVYKFMSVMSVYLLIITTSKLIILKKKTETQNVSSFCCPHCNKSITFSTGGQNAMKKQ